MVNNRDQSALCPACERFIGPADICPYCETDSAKSPVLRFMRTASLALALIGLVFLYLAARSNDIPAVRISDITPMMNFAQARIIGTVKKTDARVSEKNDRTDYLSFLIDDGSGTLRVIAYGNVARHLWNGGLAPRKDDCVEVSGSLDVAANGKAKLRINAAEQLKIRDMESGENNRKKTD